MAAPIDYEAGGQTFSTPFDFERKCKFRDTEPMLLLDTTGSFDDYTAYNGTLKRKDMAYMIIKGIVAELNKLDTAGNNEEGGGGIRTVTFAVENVKDLGDLNETNLDKQWKKIHWANRTEIVPGWKMLQRIFYEEFGDKPINEQPLQLITVITDGEAEDIDTFEKILEKEKDSYVTVIVIGYHNPFYKVNNLPDPHQRVKDSFAKLAGNNTRVRVIFFDDEIDSNKIASAILERATQTD